VPIPPERDRPTSAEGGKSNNKEDIADPDDNFTDIAEERKSCFPDQKDLNDLIRDLDLIKSNDEFLASRLRQCNLLHESVQVRNQRKHHQAFSNFFRHQDELWSCNNVGGLIKAIGITCNPDKWRLFIDSSSGSLKAILLHNGNKFPSLPLAYSVHLKEDWDTEAHYWRKDRPQWSEFSVDKELSAFKYLQDLLTKLSEVKAKAGVFVGPQITKILECIKFPKKLNRTEKAAWNSVVVVVCSFLSNQKDENYAELVQTLIKNYGIMGCRVSVKVHILNANLDKFKENMGALSEEQGEQFYQDILDFERRTI
ncbi:hypothetical protein P4O66_018690, partial [Electrophorus voltai]